MATIQQLLDALRPAAIAAGLDVESLESKTSRPFCVVCLIPEVTHVAKKDAAMLFCSHCAATMRQNEILEVVDSVGCLSEGFRDETDTIETCSPNCHFRYYCQPGLYHQKTSDSQNPEAEKILADCEENGSSTPCNECKARMICGCYSF